MLMPVLKLLCTAAAVATVTRCSPHSETTTDTSKRSVAAATSPASDSASRAAIAALNSQFPTAFKSRNAAGTAAFYEENAISMGPNAEPASGRQAIEKAYSEVFKTFGKINDFS